MKIIKTTKLYNTNNKLNKSFLKKEFLFSNIKQFQYFIIIFIIGALFFFMINTVLDREQWKWFWELSILYFFPPLGKETIIPAGLGIVSSLGLGIPLPPILWGFSIWVFDILVCCTILTNWWLLEFFIIHIPPFTFISFRRKKPRIYKKKISLMVWYENLHKKTQKFVAKKYGKVLPIALLIFMFIPFQGTGALSTTIIGTWLGLRKRVTLLIVTIGSFLAILIIMSLYLGIVEIWN